MGPRIYPVLWRLLPVFVAVIAMAVPTFGILVQKAEAVEANLGMPADGQAVAIHDGQFMAAQWTSQSAAEGVGVDAVPIYADEATPPDCLGGCVYAAQATCPSGATNPTGAACSYSTDTGSCQPGYAIDGSGGCTYVGDGSPSCPAGSTLQNGACVSAGSTQLGSTQLTCPAGYYFDGAQCINVGNSAGICPSGYVYQNNGCAYAGNITATCSAGYYFDGAQCIYVGSSSCPDGFLYQSGTCVYNGVVTANCSAGYTFNGTQCVYAGGVTGNCSAGFAWQNGTCVYLGVGSSAGYCSAGWAWQNGNCVYVGAGNGYCGSYTNPYGSLGC